MKTKKNVIVVVGIHNAAVKFHGVDTKTGLGAKSEPGLRHTGQHEQQQGYR